MAQTGDDRLLAKDWPVASHFRKSVRVEFTLFVSAMILLLMLVTGYVISDQYVRTVTRGIVDKLLVQARSYSGPAAKLIISTDGPDALLLNNTCKRLVSDDPGIYWAGIADREGVFIAHTNIRKVVSGDRMRKAAGNQFGDLVLSGEHLDRSGDTIFISVPIRHESAHLGNLLVAASAASIRDARMMSIKTVASITLVIVLVGIPITAVLVHRRLRPVKVIADHLKNVDFNDISIDIPVVSRNEFGYLVETIRVMGSKLNAARKDLIEKERISRELEIAREIQANILPHGYPGAREFELAGTYRSAREVGGDYYDFIEIDENHLGILIADVSGKSLPGMLVMLLTRDIVRRVMRTVRYPDEILADINDELLRSIKKGMFVTMFLGILDKRTGMFAFASAGHNPLLIVRDGAGKCEEIKTRGFPLGMMPSRPFVARMERAEAVLAPGDTVILYTDGISEALNSKGEEFGTNRLVQLAESMFQMPPSEFVEEVLNSLRVFVGDAEQYDDITLLTMKWVGCRAGQKAGDKRRAEHVR